MARPFSTLIAVDMLVRGPVTPFSYAFALSRSSTYLGGSRLNAWLGWLWMVRECLEMGASKLLITNLLAVGVYLNGTSGTPARFGVLDLWVRGSPFELRHTQKAGF